MAKSFRKLISLKPGRAVEAVCGIEPEMWEGPIANTRSDFKFPTLSGIVPLKLPECWLPRCTCHHMLTSTEITDADTILPALLSRIQHEGLTPGWFAPQVHGWTPWVLARVAVARRLAA